MSTTDLSTSPEATLAGLVAGVGQWCDRTDPALLSGVDAASAAEQIAVMVRRLAAKQAALAARAAECHAYSHRFASSEAWLSGLNGISHTQAKRALDTIKRLPDCPTAQAAFEAGELSVEEADLVTAAAVVNPAAESRLVERAKQHVHADTRTAADRARHAVFSREQEAARLARMRNLRRVRELTDSDQLAWVDSHFVPETWGMVRPVVDAYTDLEFQAARREGRRESLDAYRADGLIAALHAAGTLLGIDTPDPPPDTNSGGGGSAPDGEGGTPRRTEPDEPSSSPTLFTHRAEPSGVSSPTAPNGRAKPPPGGTVDPSSLIGAASVDQAAMTAEPEPSLSAESDTPGSSAGQASRTSRKRSPLAERKVVVLVDAIALARGFATDTETCEIAGPGTRVTVEWVERVMTDAAVDVLVHDRTDIRAHATVQHRRRRRAGPQPAAGTDGARPTVVVLIDALALLARDDEPSCAVPGVELRLSVEALRRLTPTRIAHAVEHDLVDLSSYRTRTRHKPRPIRLALLARDRRCSVPRCAARRHLEHDHVHDFAEGGPTDGTNLHGDCRPHHRQKTLGIARMEVTDTERLWWPPPPTDGEPGPDPSSLPWRAPLGEHLNPWDLDVLPGAERG